MLSHKYLNNLKFPIIGFIANSGTGKTTLLSKLIPELKKHGLILGLIKHTHHKITFDNKGTTRDILNHGVDVYASAKDISILEQVQIDEKNSLFDGINTYKSLNIDLLLIEGFKTDIFPKIELYRKDISKEIFATKDSTIRAIATDCPTKIDKNINADILDLNNPQQISNWIIKNVIKTRNK